MLVAVIRQRVNVTSANIPGPEVPLYLAGARVLEVSPVLPLVANEPLGVGALSYAGAFNIGVVADRDAFPDSRCSPRRCATSCTRLACRHDPTERRADVREGLTTMATSIAASGSVRVRTMPIRDVSLFVDVVGRGPPLVLMHGGPGLITGRYCRSGGWRTGSPWSSTTIAATDGQSARPSRR